MRNPHGMIAMAWSVDNYRSRIRIAHADFLAVPVAALQLDADHSFLNDMTRDFGHSESFYPKTGRQR